MLNVNTAPVARPRAASLVAMEAFYARKGLVCVLDGGSAGLIIYASSPRICEEVAAMAMGALSTIDARAQVAGAVQEDRDEEPTHRFWLAIRLDWNRVVAQVAS